jgi:hypothetical protein
MHFRFELACFKDVEDPRVEREAWTMPPGCLTQVPKALKMRCLGAEAHSPWVGAEELG